MDLPPDPREKSLGEKLQKDAKKTLIEEFLWEKIIGIADEFMKMIPKNLKMVKVNLQKPVTKLSSMIGGLNSVAPMYPGLPFSIIIELVFENLELHNPLFKHDENLYLLQSNYPIYFGCRSRYINEGKSGMV